MKIETVMAELEEAKAEVLRLRSFLEREITTHMRFGVIKEDGSTEMLPCADWCYACKLERLDKAEARLGRIAGAHTKNVGTAGMTDGCCIECGETDPCPTHVWATTDRDPLATWDPADDNQDSAETTTMFQVSWPGYRCYVAPGEYERFLERMRRDYPDVTHIDFQVVEVDPMTLNEEEE